MRTAPLRDLVDSLGGGTPSTSRPDYYGGSIPWVTPKDMKTVEVADSQVRITEAGLANSSARQVPAGSVLIVVRSGVLKHTLPVAIATRPVAINQDLRALLPLRDIDARYLLHLLRAKSPQVLRWVRATTADNFQFSRLLDLEVPLPPLDEQRRLARVLDKAESIGARRSRTLTLLAELREADFVRRFGDPQSNPLGHPIRTVGELVASTEYGSGKKAAADGRYAVLRMGNLTADGRLNLRDLKYMDMSDRERNRYLVRRGDLLFNRTNSADLVGKTAVVRTDEPMAYAGYLIRVRMADGHSPEYLAAFLNSTYGKRILRRTAKSIIGMANINARELRAIKIPVPPLGAQRAFEQAVARMEGHRERLQAQLNELDALFAALQHRAFTGQL